MSDIGAARPRPDLSAQGHARRELLTELRELEAMGFTRAEALDRILGVGTDASDEAPDAEAPDAEAPSSPSGFDPDEVAAVALRRKRPELPASVGDVIESLKRRNRW